MWDRGCSVMQYILADELTPCLREFVFSAMIRACLILALCLASAMAEASKTARRTNRDEAVLALESEG